MTHTNNQPVIAEGLLLTRQWQESSSGIRLIFWFASCEGPLQVVLENQEAVSFFPAHLKKRVENLLADIPGWRIGETELVDFAGESVAALYCRGQRQLYAARDRLSSKLIHLLESDIRPPDRFLMERFISGSAQIRGIARAADSFTEVRQAALAPATRRVPLTAVSVDIETDLSATQLYSIALYSDVCSLVLMCGEEDATAVSHADNAEMVIEYFSEPKALLVRFIACLHKLNPDILMGWNVVNFDLRCLQNFADQFKLELTLGRNQEPVVWRSSKGSDNRDYALVPGRVVLDGIELMRSANYQFESFSLESVAQRLLKRGKRVTHVDDRALEISKMFMEDKLALARYNLEDCRLVWDLFDQQGLLDFAVERSLLTGLELGRYGGSVAAMDFLYLPRLHRHGYVAPALEQLQPVNVSPGGYVLQSEPGLHHNVIVLDFKSLYPSIIRTFHVDPLALLEGRCETDTIPGFDGGKFSRKKALLPEIIEKLWDARDQAKRDNNAALSQAIKIMMNSFYGVLGTLGCRFFDTRLVSSITRRGHDIILKSKAFIEQRGFRVIYGDTDSLFVLIGATGNPATELATVKRIGAGLVNDLNRWWRETLAAEYRITSHLEMEFETHFQRFFMPTIRGSEAGSKKRYAGLMPNGEILFKGLESVRSDWSPLAREFQKELYRKIFKNEAYIDYVKQTVAALESGQYERELILRKRLGRRLSDYVKNVPPHVQAARKAETVRKSLNLPPLYEDGGWVEYIMTSSGPEPYQYRQSPIDTDFYIDKQLAPIADSILVFRQTSMSEILNRQLGLF